MAWLAGIVAGCQSAFGFALLGSPPRGGSPDSFQTTTIGYNFIGTFNPTTLEPNLRGNFTPGAGDIGDPKAAYPYQGFRRNTPVLYYSFDGSFLNFFGTNGAGEVDKALAIYNNLANVSAYSQDLSEFPTETRRVNFRAAAVALLDVKSMAVGLMSEQLGISQPVRWVWCLRNRVHIGPAACPLDQFYTVIKRNYDIVPSPPGQYQPSSYVNDVLYSYEIVEICTGPDPLADAVEFPVDPLADPYSAVADFNSLDYLGLQPGTYYTGLTRDDVAGLRYLMNSNQPAAESAGRWTVEFETNSQPFILTNQDLALFAAQAATNPPLALEALYPGLIINTVSNSFEKTVTTNITETLTNSPFDPAGFPPTHPLFTTNYATNVVPIWYYTFANLITNAFSTRGLVGTVSLGLTNSPFSPAGTPPTIVTNTKMTFVKGTFGGFFLLPTNSCQVQVLSNIFTQVIYTTNLPSTNGLGGGAAPTNAITFTPGSITVFTNATTVYLAITCPTNTVATRQGVEKITFIRRDYDSLINQFWSPVTNDYTLTELRGSTYTPMRMQRVVPRPDFLYTCADLAIPAQFSYSNGITTTNFNGSNVITETWSVGPVTGFAPNDTFRTIAYDDSIHPGNLAGPGTIESGFIIPALFVFNSTGPIYENDTAVNAPFLNEATQAPLFDISWGSFDGTTNAPTVYPNGTNITILESVLTGPFLVTSTLPAVNVGSDYSAQLSGTGGQPPYTWSLSPGSPGLPAGLNLTSDGLISGTATGPGGGTIYDFSIRLTDSAGAYKDEAFTITVF